MMSLIRCELKIMGINPILILSASVAVFALLAVLGGDLLNLSTIGFEVIYPFFAAIAVGEWGKTRADDNYDAIASQGKSLFAWVVFRFLAVFATVGVFAVLSMIIVSLVRNEIAFMEMILIYFSPAFFLATLSALLNLCFSQEHISILICGVFWLVSMLANSLVRFLWIRTVYLFIRYAGFQSGIWLVNKSVLLMISLGLWGIIFLLCKKIR